MHLSNAHANTTVDPHYLQTRSARSLARYLGVPISTVHGAYLRGDLNGRYDTSEGQLRTRTIDVRRWIESWPDGAFPDE